MRCKSIRCGICGNWARFGDCCHYCGAYRLVISAKVEYYNRAFIRMGRAIPLPEVNEFVLGRVITRAIAQYNAENPEPEKVQVNWNLVRAMRKAGASKEQIAQVIGRPIRDYKK